VAEYEQQLEAERFDLGQLGFEPTAGVLINPGLLGGRLAALRMAGSALAGHPPGPDR
jgi:hypothetical protein